MSSSPSKKNQTRRAFFSDVTASTALAAAAIAQLGSPVAAMAQEKKAPLDSLRMPKNLPPWRNVVDTSLLAAVNISGPGQEAEGRVKFSAPTKEDYSAPAIAEKHLTVNYETGKAGLTEDGKLQGILSMDDIVLRASSAGATTPPEVTSGEALDTLQGIYKSRPSRARIITQL